MFVKREELIPFYGFMISNKIQNSSATCRGTTRKLEKYKKAADAAKRIFTLSDLYHQFILLSIYIIFYLLSLIIEETK